MRIIYLDIDTTRADHLGCYGYHKNTTPNIDVIAKDGVVFENFYCSDAPCLPSRTALFTGQFGIRTGVVGHGQTTSQLHIDATRKFRSRYEFESLFGMLRNKGFYTVGVTPFASRHSAWYFYGGFSEIYDTGKRGIEQAHDVVPTALDWLTRNQNRDNWYLHINLWDPHTPHRTPLSHENPFVSDSGPDWITQEVLDAHKQTAGPHHAQELMMFTDQVSKDYPRQVGRLDTLKDVKRLFDGYDIGIHYADSFVGKIVDLLKEQGIFEDTAIIVSSDHGENMGELGIYAEHGTADQGTCRIPMIIKWPTGRKGVKAEGLHYNLDLISTLAELLEIKPSPEWDGKSFAKTIIDGTNCGHDHLVLSQMCHVCQRSVRTRDYIYIRTYHDGYHFFPKHMLFNLKDDPHEQHNLAPLHPEVVDAMASKLLDWHDQAMKKNRYLYEDPMSTVLREGGPFHASMQLKNYVNHLEKTGRSEYIEKYKELYPHEFKDRS